MRPAGDVDLAVAGGLCVTCNDSSDVTTGNIYLRA